MNLKTEKADLSALRIDHEKHEGGNTAHTKYVVIGAAALLVLAGTVLWLTGAFTPAKEVTVTTAVLTSPSSANALLTASGYVVAQQKAAIASKATGRLVYLGVEEGDRVRKNQIIARIEDEDVQAALQQARANYELARADFEDARQWVERQRTLYASGMTSKAELDAAEARFKRVEAAIKAAEAALRAAEVDVENTRIRAPFDGTVLTKNANVGEVVAPFAAAVGSKAAVVTIADLSSLEVETDVSEANITRVVVGAPCEITLDAYPDRRYRGYVHKIVPTADRAKATVLTKVRFAELDDRVLPEMSAKVTFLSKTTDPSATAQPLQLTIPSSALVQRNGSSVVFLVQDDIVVEQVVQTSGTLGDRVVIVAGLKPGDRVVLQPDASLSSGARVTIRQ